MHICIVTEDFLPNIGGMSQHVYEIARCFVAQGHQVMIVNQVLGQRPETVEQFEGMRVIRSSFTLPVPKLRIVPYSIKLRRTLIREHRRQPIDVVHWHDLRAGLAVKYLPLDCPKVFTNHSSSFLMGLGSALFRSYYRFTLGGADRFLAPSQELADETQKLLGRSVTYVPNGFDPDRFQPQDNQQLRTELGIGDDESVLLVPRRLAPKNGVYVLAQALPRILRQHPAARLVVTGGGFPDERARIEKHARDHGVLQRIMFMDGVDNKLMPRYYNIADLVIMPSFMEAVSLSALEAMACEKCVVASDVGGLSQLFADGDWGHLVPAGDPDALADAIIGLLDDPSRRSEVAANARRHALAHYTWQQVAKETLAVYRDAAA